MPYEAEVFRAKRPTKGSRPANAGEKKDYVLEALRGKPCALSVEQIADCVEEGWTKISQRDVLIALKKLATEGKVAEQGGAWKRVLGAK